MMKQTNGFDQLVDSAVNALKNGRYLEAERNMNAAMAFNPHSPVVQNLFGILSRFEGDYSLARKHFRAAYALDPTYKPAIRNLESISAFHSLVDNMQMDFGDTPEVDEENPYMIVYDDRNVGHVIKKKLESGG